MINKILNWQLETFRLFAAPLIVTEAILISLGFGLLMIILPTWLRITIMIILPFSLFFWIKGLKQRRHTH